jgi:hypothetical protein
MKPRSHREGGYGESAQTGGVSECGRDALRNLVVAELGGFGVTAGARSGRRMGRLAAKRRSRMQRCVAAP